MAQHFLASGRRRIGLLSGPPLPSTIRNREAGFLEASGEQPMTVRVDAFTYKAGVEGMERLLALADRACVARIDAACGRTCRGPGPGTILSRGACGVTRAPPGWRRL